MVFSARSRSSAGTSIFGSIMIAFSNVVPDVSIHPDGVCAVLADATGPGSLPPASVGPSQGNYFLGIAVFRRKPRAIPMMSAIWHTDSRLGPIVCGVASLLGTWGYDAANIPADTNMHALSNP